MGVTAVMSVSIRVLQTRLIFSQVRLAPFPVINAARRFAAGPLPTAIPAFRFASLLRAPFRKRTVQVRPMRAEAAFASSFRFAVERGDRLAHHLVLP